MSHTFKQIPLQQIGAHFIVGLSASTLLPEEELLLEELRPAGIILFSHNIEKNSASWKQQLQTLIASAKKASKRKDFLVSIDHEGGKVHRLISPVTHFPEAQQWASYAYEVGKVFARELRSLSFNLNFAPVLDIDSEPQNPIIGKRAFGKTAEVVSAAAINFFRGATEEGILSCGKHFPGHGATIKDSHLELPRVDAKREILFSRELLPFKKFIETGIHLLMTAHVLYPALDDKRPGTISPKIISNLLRNELGYKHVVISDALEMKALSDQTDSSLGVSCLKAGVDIMLIGQSKEISPLQRAKNQALEINAALERGELSKTVIEESDKRLQELFSYLGTIQKKTSPIPSEKALGCDEHLALLKKIETSALV